MYPSKLSIRDLAYNIPIKYNHWPICKSVQLFEPVVVSLNVVSVPVCHCFHVIKEAIKTYFC